ncbi:MAG: putative quinol monooxygenase [Caulobacteraceae bacterium]
MIKVVAKSRAKSDKLDRILELSKEMVEKTVKEEGCIRYELFQDVKDPNTLIILEEWENEEALGRHMASEHFKRLVPQMNEFRERASEINICRKLF